MFSIQQKSSLDYWTSQLDNIWLEQMSMIHKGKNIDEAIAQSFGHLISDEIRLQNTDIGGFKRLVNTWLSNSKINGKQNGAFKNEHPAQAAARAFAERVGGKSN